MEVFCEILIAALICGAFLALIRMAQGWLVLPVHSGKEISVQSVIRVSGDCEGLEYTLRGLGYLRSSRKLQTDIRIIPGELTPQGERILRSAAERNQQIQIEKE